MPEERGRTRWGADAVIPSPCRVLCDATGREKSVAGGRGRRPRWFQDGKFSRAEEVLGGGWRERNSRRRSPRPARVAGDEESG